MPPNRPRPFTQATAPILISVPYNVPTDALGAIVTVPFACRIVAILGRVITAGTGGAATGVLKKAPSATAITGGTAIHAGSWDFVGAADANQTLALSATTAASTLAAGDSIGWDITGTTTSATGNITIALLPLGAP